MHEADRCDLLRESMKGIRWPSNCHELSDCTVRASLLSTGIKFLHDGDKYKKDSQMLCAEYLYG